MQTPVVVNALSLVAVDKVHGYAFVRNGDGTFFGVQPPYLADTITPANKLDVERGFDYAHGTPFEPGDDLPFLSWEMLFKWLDNEFVEARTRLGLPLPSPADAEKYIRECSAQDAHQFLDIVRRFLTREDKRVASLRLLRNLLDAPVVRNDDQLRTETLALQNLVRINSLGDRVGFYLESRKPGDVVEIETKIGTTYTMVVQDPVRGHVSLASDDRRELEGSSVWVDLEASVTDGQSGWTHWVGIGLHMRLRALKGPGLLYLSTINAFRWLEGEDAEIVRAEAETTKTS